MLAFKIIHPKSRRSSLRRTLIPTDEIIDKLTRLHASGELNERYALVFEAVVRAHFDSKPVSVNFINIAINIWNEHCPSEPISRLPTDVPRN